MDPKNIFGPHPSENRLTKTQQNLPKITLFRTQNGEMAKVKTIVSSHVWSLEKRFSRRQFAHGTSQFILKGSNFP